MTKRALHVVTIGAALSANKGAASMLRAVLDTVPASVGPCRITVLSTFPEADRAALDHPDVEVLAATPRQILFPLLPCALLAWVLRLVRVEPRRVFRKGTMGALCDADIVLDLAGISFADGRGIPILGYNTLMTGIPLLFGAPVLKCSQALGTFDTRLNRWMARWVLGNVAGICARGASTAANVRGLGLRTPVVEAADLAFLMATPVDHARHAAELVPEGPFVVVAPSSVVQAYCEKSGIDYLAVMTSIVRRFLDEGTSVVLMAHSFRPGDRPGRMNDGPVCHAIVAALGSPPNLTLIAGDEPPTTLRAVIGASQLMITSRFHGMVSALATCTPVVVLGWSHKYAEVMEEFELGPYVLPFTDAADAALWEQVQEVREHRDQLASRIQQHLQHVTASATRNLGEISRIIG